MEYSPQVKIFNLSPNLPLEVTFRHFIIVIIIILLGLATYPRLNGLQKKKV